MSHAITATLRTKVESELGRIFESGGLRIAATSCATVDALHGTVGPTPATGWVTLPHEVRAFEDERPPDGPWLSAELVRGDTTWHVRQTGEGWTVFRYERLPDGDHEIERVAYLARHERVALYDVHWSREPLPQGLVAAGVDVRPWAVKVAVFRGWK